MENYKGINKKGLAFHAEAKQKKLQRRKETNQTLCSRFSLRFVSFYKFFCSKDLEKIL